MLGSERLGVMDPTRSSGELTPITGLDIQAFDVIGWNLTDAVVPEPGTIMLVGSGVLGLSAYRWRRRRKEVEA